MTGIERHEAEEKAITLLALQEQRARLRYRMQLIEREIALLDQAENQRAFMEAMQPMIPGPLVEGSQVLANCGAQIDRVRFAFTWDGELVGCVCDALQIGRNVCRACATHAFNQRYIYGIVNGEEMKHESEAA